MGDFFFSVDSAREALTDMPPRWEEELDSVTLHNQALCSMDMSPTQGFHKLQFLMQQSTYPQETLQNLLILYCKHGYHDLASDVISTYSPVKDKYLSNVRKIICLILVSRQLCVIISSISVNLWMLLSHNKHHLTKRTANWITWQIN